MLPLAERLKECRKKKNVTQSEAARVFGIELRSYIRYETGESQPKLEMLVKIAGYYGVTTDYLLGVEGGPGV